MKKSLFLTIFAAMVVSLFAQELPNRKLFIEGSAIRQNHFEFFFLNFRKEAVGAGYTLADKREDAGFIFKFDVTNNPDKAIDGNQFSLRIGLVDNSNGHEILYYFFYFNNLDEMPEHTHYLFYRAVSVIPPLTEDAILQADAAWKNKLIYLRASFDYPVNFFRLQPDGLFRKIGVYDGPDINNPGNVNDLDHKTIVNPGITIGVEYQFLDYMSAELNLKANMGDFDTNYFLNLALQVQLKFPIKTFRPFVIEPYIGGMFPILTSDVFSDYPFFLLGGGVQINIKGVNNKGAFFLDINCMTSLTDAIRKNPYVAFPNPPGIHYRPFFVGLGIGYKFGFKDRPRKNVQYRFVCDCGCETEMPAPPVQDNSKKTDKSQKQQEPQKQQEQQEQKIPQGREKSSRTRTFYF